MNLAADMGRHSGRATPSLHDAPYRQIEEATGRRSTYPLPILVQTNRATSKERARPRPCGENGVAESNFSREGFYAVPHVRRLGYPLIFPTLRHEMGD